MERPINKRIKQIIGELKLSQNQFAKEIGISSTLISQIVSTQSNFGVEVLQRIVSRYPEFNYDWLIAGRGKMYLAETTHLILNEPEVKYMTRTEVEQLIKDQLSEKSKDSSKRKAG